MIHELHLYDFDGTLFRSPDEPSWWPKDQLGSFFFHPASLDFPAVPQEPGPRWWVTEVVTSARVSITSSTVYTVLATGRYDGIYRDRVRELLQQKGLNFDQAHCNPDERTAVWKRRLFIGIAAGLFHLKRVHIWEDNKEYLQVYLEAFKDERPDLQVSWTLVDVNPQSLADTPEYRKSMSDFLSSVRVAARFRKRAFGY